MNRRFCTTSILLMLTGIVATAQSFKTEQLRQAAKVLGVETMLDSLESNQTIYLSASDNQAICVRTDKKQVVEHIGIPLFNEPMRVLMPSPVYDFMEYAVLNWKYKVNPNTLYLSKVLFRKGSWKSLLNSQLNECDCTIENVDDKLYIVTWQRDSQDVAVVGIPIEYELLCNESRRNIERNFIKQLSDIMPSDNIREHEQITEDCLKIYGTEGLFVIEGRSYMMPELNQNTYYILKTIYQPIDTVYQGNITHMVLEDVVPALVSDEDHPIETFTNLVMADNMESPDANTEIDFHLSDYHRKKLNIPLSQLKAFCTAQGDNLYFAFSNMTSEQIKGVLFAVNAAKGYNHLFSITMPKQELVDANPTMDIHAYLFIPPISKEKLFSKTPTKKSGAKIY